MQLWWKPQINVIELHGLIAARLGQLNVKSAQPLIEKGFASAKGRPVILDIDSPGGSPVQSDLIATLIRRRAEKAKVEVHAVISDIGASGGYWIACAADQIHANPMSLVGSIGVRGGGFGFSDLMARIGIERRLYTAGAHKATLDPFLPENPDDVARIKALQREIHAIFIALVKQSRGSRLKGADDTLFTGEYWAGETSVSLGLADAVGDLRSTLRARYGEKVEMPVIAPPTGLLAGLLGRKPGAGTGVTPDGFASLPDELISALETRAIWGRFGF